MAEAGWSQDSGNMANVVYPDYIHTTHIQTWIFFFRILSQNKDLLKNLPVFVYSGLTVYCGRNYTHHYL